MTPIPVERTVELDTPLGKDEAPRATAPSAVRAPSWRALLNSCTLSAQGLYCIICTPLSLAFVVLK